MRSLRTLAFAAAVFAVPALAMAEPGGHPGGPCKSDLQSLCAGVQPGGGRIRDCMKEHRTQLSTACKVAIADRMLERKGHNGPGGQRTVEGQSALGNTSIKSAPARN